MPLPSPFRLLLPRPWYTPSPSQDPSVLSHGVKRWKNVIYPPVSVRERREMKRGDRLSFNLKCFRLNIRPVSRPSSLLLLLLASPPAPFSPPFSSSPLLASLSSLLLVMSCRSALLHTNTRIHTLTHTHSLTHTHTHTHTWV